MHAVATFGAGCFWGVEETFLRTPGVLTTTVGYCGGSVDHPTYEMVCSGTTGHAEAVQVTYDPNRISYTDLLRIFFEHHNPTTLDRQGPDIGDQYRSVIFFHDAMQEDKARDFISALEKAKKFKNPIVNQIAPFTEFFPAEEYHQQYLRKRGLESCHIQFPAN